MGRPKKPLEITAVGLAAELRTSRKKGIREIEEAEKPQLAALARRLADDPMLPLSQLAAAAVETALARYDDGSVVQAIRLLLKIDPNARSSGWELSKRRDEAAKLLKALPMTSVRHREDRVLDELGKQLAALLAAREAGQAPSEVLEVVENQPESHATEPAPLASAARPGALKRTRSLAVIGTVALTAALVAWTLTKRDHDAAARTPHTSLEAMVGTGEVGHPGNPSRKPLTAKPGDDVVVELYYANLAPDHSGIDALNVTVRPELPHSVSRVHPIAFAVDASNSKVVKAHAIVQTAQPSRLVLVPGSVRRRHNVGSPMRPRWVTTRVADSAILGPLMVVERDQFAGNAFSQTLMFKMRVTSA